jgi:transcriptional regulator with XRE-family HTH domain
MRSLKQLREALDLSQEHMAIYIGVTRSLLAMAEKGTRSLPVKAYLRMAQLEKSLRSNVQYKAASLQQHATADAALVRNHAKKCIEKAAVIKLQLAALEKDYQQCLTALLATGYLMNQLPEGEAGKKDRLWLELLELQTLKKMKDCGNAVQVILQLRINALEHESRQAGKIKF